MGDRLKDKVVVITGGTSGIGAATAELFVAEGAFVVFCGRTLEKGKTLADRLGSNAVFVEADVLVEEEIKGTIDTAVQKFGGLDILFNNAGGPAGESLSLTEVTPEAVQYAMQLLFTSVVLGIKYAIPYMEDRGGGAIINNSSIAGLRDGQGSLLYSAAKAALTHYSKLAGTRLGSSGIRVNTISPGAVATPIFWGGSSVEVTDEEYNRKMTKLQGNLARATPLKVSGMARDCALGALYLASDEGKYVTCHDLVIDGGRTSMFHESPRD